MRFHELRRRPIALTWLTVVLALAAGAGWAFAESTVTVREAGTEQVLRQPLARWLPLTGASVSVAAVLAIAWLSNLRFAGFIACAALAVSVLLAAWARLDPEVGRPARLDAEVARVTAGCAGCEVSTGTGFWLLVALCASLAGVVAAGALATTRHAPPAEPGPSLPDPVRGSQ